MYAIVKTGGKQYKVEQGTIFKVEKLNAKVGSQVELETLLVCDGDNLSVAADAAKVKVVATVLEHGKGEKINIFTYKPKKNIRHRQGHRQPYTKLKVESIG